MYQVTRFVISLLPPFQIISAPLNIQHSPPLLKHIILLFSSFGLNANFSDLWLILCWWGHRDSLNDMDAIHVYQIIVRSILLLVE